MKSPRFVGAASLAIALILVSSPAFAGRGGFRGGSFGGSRGGSFEGSRSESFGGSRGGGFEGGRSSSFSGSRSGSYEGSRSGSYGGSSYGHSSYGTSHSYGGYEGMGGMGGKNPYSASGSSSMTHSSATGAYGGSYQSGTRSGSSTNSRGGSVEYGAAGHGGTGPGGVSAGRGVYGAQVTTAGGKSYTTAGKVGGVSGPNGYAAGGHSSVGVAQGPNGTAVGGSRSGFASGPGGAVAGGSRGYAAAGSNGAVAGGSRGFVAAGSNGGVAAGRGYGYGYGSGGGAWGGGHYGGYGAYNSGWVHGNWGGGYGGWGGAGLGLGLAAWGIGSALYSNAGGWGYMPYSNPYYVQPTAVAVQPAYNYGQPINTDGPVAPAATADPAMAAFDEARARFKDGDYPTALALADDAIKGTPGNSAAHEFRGVVLFALKRYEDSAGTLYGVLSAGPGWDWTTLIGLYPDEETYTGQLRALEGSCRAHPDDASGRFVLAYLYLTAGQDDAAVGVLKTIVALQPKDRVSAQLLQSLTKSEAPAPAPPAEPAPGGQLAGAWVASPGAGTTVALRVAANGKFTWTVETKGQTHQLSGQSTSGDGVLTLVQDEGGAPMVGHVTWKGADEFVFQALGGGSGDPGLDFRRAP